MTARGIGGQIRSTDCHYVNGFRRIAIVSRVRPRVRPRVARCHEKSLALRRKFLEYGIKLRSVIRIPSPGAAQLLGDIFGGHIIEYVDVADTDLRSAGSDIYANLAYPRSHGRRLHDIQNLFSIIAV